MSSITATRMPSVFLHCLLTATNVYAITDMKEMVITVLLNLCHVLKQITVTSTQLALTTSKREDLYVCAILDTKEMDISAKQQVIRYEIAWYYMRTYACNARITSTVLILETPKSICNPKDDGKWYIYSIFGSMYLLPSSLVTLNNN